MQAAYVVEQSSTPWELLRDLTGNFPSLASSLAQVVVPDSFRETLKRTSNRQGGEGRESGLLNGRSLDLSTASPFSLYSMIQEELALHDTMEMMDVPLESIPSLLRVPISSKMRHPYRLALLPSFSLPWLNDLSSDRAYSRWPTSLYELYKPTYPDQMRFIAQNLINVVFAVEPLSQEALNVYPVVDMFLGGSAPLRMAFLFDRSNVTNEKLGSAREYRLLSDIEEPLEDLVISSFKYLTDIFSYRKAASFLALLATKAKDSEVTIELIDSSLREISSIGLLEVYSEDHQATIDKYLNQITDFVVEKGIQNVNTAFVNGLPITKVADDFTVRRLSLSSELVTETVAHRTKDSLWQSSGSSALSIKTLPSDFGERNWKMMRRTFTPISSNLPTLEYRHFITLLLLENHLHPAIWPFQV